MRLLKDTRWWTAFESQQDNIRALVFRYTRGQLEFFDKAVKDSRRSLLENIMNDAWFNAPDSRGVYDIPGFTMMCNLLDGSYDTKEKPCVY